MIGPSGRKLAKHKGDGNNDDDEKNILFHSMNVFGNKYECKLTHLYESCIIILCFVTY